MKTEFTGIHHTAFATHNIELTVKFWRDLLGMRLVYAYGSPGYRQYFFLISGNNRISFFEWHDVEPVRPRRHGDPVKGSFIFDHIAIGVADKNALWEIMSRLDAAGFHCSDIIDHGCFLSIYSYDPNGIPIEFSCEVPGHDLFWNPVMKDLAATSGFLTEPNPVPGQWPKPEPVSEEERIIVPGEGKDFFPEIPDRTPQSTQTSAAEGAMQVHDVMHRGVYTTTENDTIRSVAETIASEKISGLPVVDDNNRLVGVISEKDILKALLPGYTQFLDDPAQALDFQAMESSYGGVLQKSVGELMSPSVISIEIDAPVMKAAAQMDLHGFRRIPVVDQDRRLAGIISLSDIHQAIFVRELEDASDR
ncbi:MAG: CBS domain-containing protein [Candidatus Thiodiazotropha taylori]|nr:CBS domain-containing protein [Candidatus Thiodiazotropha taylori]MCW4223559.1 CBS domain-containing protein [Candidatus Thiodiazotropha endolucinida]MCG7884177.1 CBS domain-containing protein [Candidatus Thiodiazotropha taylori]MCG7885136.1 CBS domain-containing protein [Candidatus Thiodiazotropha taylori]MCG7891820.1 CBS domain-containing protein [Candidatus Thiodiazotropha taylori]